MMRKIGSLRVTNKKSLGIYSKTNSRIRETVRVGENRMTNLEISLNSTKARSSKLCTGTQK